MTAPKKKSRQFTVKGWTYETLQEMCPSMKDLYVYNQRTADFCQENTRVLCEKEKTCRLSEPDGDWNRAEFVGIKNYKGGYSVPNLVSRVHRKMRRLFRQCRPVKIVIHEDEQRLQKKKKGKQNVQRTKSRK